MLISATPTNFGANFRLPIAMAAFPIPAPASAARADDDWPSEFGRLILIARENDALAAELAANKAAIAEARAYLSRPDANEALGRARLERLRLRRSGYLARLRANRIEVRAILDGREPADRATGAALSISA